MIDQETEIYALSESSVTVVFGDEISSQMAEKVSALNTAIHNSTFEGLITTVPAYASLTVYYDPEKVLYSGLAGESVYQKVSGYLSALPVRRLSKENSTRLITVPVCYGGTYGPDLEFVARHSKLTTDEVITLHASATYTVYMIGFIPGFAYMGGMDTRLSTPRKQQPRTQVNAGSVGIAANQTGIYPLDIPGGWQIIGQTPIQLFNASRPEPSYLKAGDTVRFKPLTINEFKSLTS